MVNAALMAWKDKDDEQLPYLKERLMRSVGPCCDSATFREAFMPQWRKRYTQDADTPDFIVSKAKHYWKIYSMTGFEAAETVHQKLRAGVT